MMRRKVSMFYVSEHARLRLAAEEIDALRHVSEMMTLILSQESLDNFNDDDGGDTDDDGMSVEVEFYD